ncbi:hypothetical protein ACJJTC_006911 [Scirpophaga incertulas]
MRYSKHLDNLRRFRLEDSHQCEGCSLPPGVLEDGIHLIARVVPRGQAKNIIATYRILRDLWENLCVHELKSALKTFSGEAKRGGRYIHKWWRNMTHWDLMYGYTEYKDLSALREEVRDWLVEPKKIGEGLCGESEFVERMYQEAVTFLSREWKPPRELPTLREWVATGVWMRGKAGTGATISIKVEGKTRRTRRYKGVDAVLFSDRCIEEELLGPAHEEMVVLQKSEGGKVRPVVKTGNKINRKMDFLSELVEKGLYGSRVSTLFAGSQGNEEIDMEWAREVRNPDSLKVPLDQGGFDQHQSLPTIKAVLTAIGDVCVRSTPPGSEYREVWEMLWFSLMGRRVEVRLGGETFTWGNGIPSGWRWTALLDTLLNYCSLRVIQGLTQARIGRGIPLGMVTVQGDDVMMTMRGLDDAAEIIEGYGAAGYEVHPAKTFFSRERGEFLRRSYEPGVVTGYITRTQLAIRFRNPVLEMPVSKEERAASRAALWMLFRNRGADPRMVAECMVEDLTQSGMQTADIYNYLLTPAAVGGVGIRGPNDSVAYHLEAARTRLGIRPAWIVPIVTKPSLRIVPNYGQWGDRIKRLGVRLEGRHKEEFEGLLARTWGLREADITGKVEVAWTEEEVIKPYNPSLANPPLPRGGDLWDLDHVPVLLRGPLKAQAMEDGTWKNWIKKELLESALPGAG